MALTQAVVGGRITAAIINAIINLLELGGSTRVIPTVSGSGVSVSSTTGVVTFTAATTITCDSLPSGYTMFEIDYVSVGTSSNVLLVLRTSAPADVVTNYDSTSVIGRNAATTSTTNIAATSFAPQPFSNTHHAGNVMVYSLTDAIETRLISTCGAQADPAVSNTSNGVTTLFGVHRDATAYTGFKITFSAAQTGTLRIRAVI
jgi:hypothetical protein